MTTTQYLRAFARFWWLIVICAAVGVLTSFAIGAETPASYRAYSSVAMATTRAVPQDASSLTSANALAVQRMGTYVAAADGTALAEQIPDDERSGASVSSLAKRLEVSNSTGATVLQVSATGSTEGEARKLADIGANAMVRVVANVEDTATPGRPLLRARPLRPSADQPVEVSEGSVWQAPVLCGAAGLLVGLALAVVISRAAPRLRDRRTAAELVGAPVLGAVPLGKAAQRGARGPEARAEAIDGVRSGLFFLRQGDSCLTVSLTPSHRVDCLGDMVDDLASSLVAAGARVLVVDTDLTAPEEDRPVTAGLAEHLSGTAPLKGLVRRAQGGHHVITAGSRPGSPADLLHHAALDTLLSGAASRYDYVLAVTSPVLEPTGATAVAGRCAAAVLVVPERTRAAPVRESVAALAAVGATVRGAIVVR